MKPANLTLVTAPPRLPPSHSPEGAFVSSVPTLRPALSSEGEAQRNSGDPLLFPQPSLKWSRLDSRIANPERSQDHLQTTAFVQYYLTQQGAPECACRRLAHSFTDGLRALQNPTELKLCGGV